MRLEFEHLLLQSSPRHVEEIIERTPFTQQDVFWLIYHLRLSALELLQVRAGDVDPEGMKVKRCRIGWAAVPPDVRDRVLRAAEDTDPRERLFEPHKPLLKALQGLQASYRRGVRLTDEFHKMEGKTIAHAPLPNFLVLGSPRCATTWLYEVMRRHPDVYIPRKELEFFSSHHYTMGINWYKRAFRDWRGQHLIGDVSVGYFGEHKAHTRIKTALSDKVKLIVIVREPVDRLISHYKLRFMSCNAPRCLERALKMWTLKRLLIWESRYDLHMSNLLEYFKPENILLLRFEDLQKDPRGFLERLAVFLGIDPAPLEAASPRVNLSGHVARPALHVVLRGYLEPGVILSVRRPRLRRALISIIARMDDHMCISRSAKLKVKAETIRLLAGQFKEGNSILENLTGLDLSDWETDVEAKLSRGQEMTVW